MTKQLTNRHIEVVTRELRNAVDGVIKAWQEDEPYPSWEEDAEWRRLNPSPRELHQVREKEVREALNAETNDLLLRIQLGSVAVSEIYDELKQLLDRLNERRLSYLHTPNRK